MKYYGLSLFWISFLTVFAQLARRYEIHKNSLKSMCVALNVLIFTIYKSALSVIIVVDLSQRDVRLWSIRHTLRLNTVSLVVQSLWKKLNVEVQMFVFIRSLCTATEVLFTRCEKCCSDQAFSLNVSSGVTDRVRMMYTTMFMMEMCGSNLFLLMAMLFYHYQVILLFNWILTGLTPSSILSTQKGPSTWGY